MKTIGTQLESDFKRYAPNDLPSKVTKLLYITYGVGRYNQGEIMVADFDRSGSSSGFEAVKLGSFSMEIAIPDGVDIKKKYLAVLEEQKRDVQAAYTVKLSEVQNKIDQLLALPAPKDDDE